MSKKEPFIFLVAGEPSGDELGGRLMAALTEATHGRIRFAGVGGPAMEAQGLESLFPMRELSVMGIMEVLPHIPKILRRVRETAAAINTQQPDIVVTIDSPTFAYRVVQKIERSQIKLVHYVAPSVWAWRPWRVHKIGRCFDLVLALLPFEPPFFERVGVACTFVGHPVLEYGAGDGDGAAFRRRHGIGDGEELICVLPGSRRGEVSRLGREFGETLTLLAKRRPGLKAVVPTVPGVEPLVRAHVDEWTVPTLVVMGADEKYGAMAASNAALAASGTVAIELAMARLPTVIAYRVSAVTAAIVRRLIRVKYVNLVNIILNRMVIPERLQEDCQASILAEDLEQLLGPAGQKQIKESVEAIAALSVGDVLPSRRAAQALLDLVESSETDP
jgi:lipid-A-disaccharide synthase